jgi:hypothetical protein
MLPVTGRAYQNSSENMQRFGYAKYLPRLPTVPGKILPRNVAKEYLDELLSPESDTKLLYL